MDAVQSLFNDSIPAKYRPLAVLPEDVATDFDMRLAAVLGEGRVFGGVYWGRDFEDSMQLAAGGGRRMAEAFDREVRILQNVAVAPSERNQGVGGALVRHVEAEMVRAHIPTLIGVATGDSWGFFERLGFYVYPPESPIRIGLHAGGIVTIPIEGPDVRWFAKDLSGRI